MKHRLALIVTATLAVPLAVSFATPPASATTVSQRGLRIVVPSSRTVYNGGSTAVTSSVRVSTGTTKVVRSSSTIAWRAGRRVAAAKTVHLAAGSYQLQTKITYQRYVLVTKTRTVKVFHEGGEPDGSQCVVTASHDEYGEGFPDYIDTATCTNRAYPTRVTAQNPIDNGSSGEYDVGQTFTSDYIEYPAYYTTQVQSYKVRNYYPQTSFTTSKHTLTVHNGGHRKIFVYSESHTTSYVNVPGNARAYYDFDCSSFGYSGNWIVTLHQPGSVLNDEQLANVIQYSGDGVYHFPHSGKFRFEVITECDWAISVYWR